MPTRLFRKPPTTVLRSPTFGLPRLTFGRTPYSPEIIILHVLRCSLDSYDAQETNPFIRNKAEPKHPSLHYAIDYEGNVHQYVEDADIAWGLWDYSMTSFPSTYPEGTFDLPHASITPDYYSLHIGAMSGERDVKGERVIFSDTELLNHARLIAWLCHTYEIDCDLDHVTTHDQIDTQFEHVCVTDDYPLAAILALAQQIIADGGEYDVVFEPPPVIEEYIGVFIIGFSRIGSQALIRDA